MVTFVAEAECIELFAKRFKALTGNAPFPWQESLFLRFVSEIFPGDVSLPTGTGKTSIMAIWLLALAEKLSVDVRQNAIPRRLIWVVNRRVVVDQATSEAEQLRRRLNDLTIAEFEPIRCVLKKLSENGSDEILGISTLRGQFEDNAEWRDDPSRPAVIVGTIDMIGSRLLFSGYGIGFKAKPLHAGFLGQDALLIHDEAHLEPAFQELLVAMRKEQERCNEFGKFHVMALSATSRAGDGSFGLTSVEKEIPIEIPDPPGMPLHIIWRRQSAIKKICLRENADEKNLAEEIAKEALQFKDSNCAVLVFVQKVEDVEKILKKLPRGQSQQLTGTQRGFERDKLVKNDPIFRRFLSQANPATDTVYLVCTAAGEVGVNMSADHLVCDLSTFDSMVQRFGRVNRFGDRRNTEIHVFYPKDLSKDNKLDASQQPEKKQTEKTDLDKRRKVTLDLIRELNSDGSPMALSKLDPNECLAAFAPTPTILPATDILFDSWALTTIRGKFPGRPPVEPYLHGVSSDPPETHVAWREEVDIITGELLEQYSPEDLLEDYPLKPHELLRDRSDRIYTRLCKLAERRPDTPAWLYADDGSVEPMTLGRLKEGRKDKINNITVLLPPSAGGLSKEGSLDGDSETADDVADEWRNVEGVQRRIRVWDNNSIPSKTLNKMRLIRTIDTDPEADGLEEGEADKPKYWHWYELPKGADNDGSKRDAGPVEWQVHTDDVVRNATRIVEQLPLCDELWKAVIAAARIHDFGKRRSLFQRVIGNVNCTVLLAKSGRKKELYSLNAHFRHEFASLLDAQKEPAFSVLSLDMQELALHLVAAHHGRGRPHFPSEEACDPEATDEQNAMAGVEVPQRFARLQRKYGRWGLAYLESLLRAADYAASANPSAIWEGNL